MTAAQGEPDAATTHRLRADAERNRQRILDVASRVFAEHGLHVTLNDIAREAGVGVGTVYRKFPDKNALIDALSDKYFHRILTHIGGTGDDGEAPALRELMMGMAAIRAEDRGLFPILFAAGVPSPERDAKVTEVLHAWDAAIDRAVSQGAVRPEFSAVDVDIFMLAVGAVADATHSIAPLAWKRCAEVLLDGFDRPGAQSPLEEIALDEAQRRAIFLNV